MHDEAIYEKPMLIIKLFLLIIVIGMVIWFLAGIVIKPKEAKIYINSQSGMRTFTAKVAETDEARAQGLSGTSFLTPNDALLMIFPYSDTWGIWMKDMNYSIDVVWLNESFEVIHTERSMHPSSYPDNVYRPRKPARYVVELPEATISKLYLKVGDKIKVEIQ